MMLILSQIYKVLCLCFLLTCWEGIRGRVCHLGYGFINVFGHGFDFCFFFSSDVMYDPFLMFYGIVLSMGCLDLIIISIFHLQDYTFSASLFFHWLISSNIILFVLRYRIVSVHFGYCLLSEVSFFYVVPNLKDICIKYSNHEWVLQLYDKTQ